MRDNDLVVATGAKSGTTFMLYCSHQVRTKGQDTNDELFPDVSLSTPWPDLIQSRGGSWAEQKDRYNTTIVNGKPMSYYWDNPSYKFRIFKSHFAPPELPVGRKGGKKIKYLAMVRNGLDMAQSMQNFYAANSDAFRNLWGGFPPDVGADVMDKDGFHPAVKDLLPGGPLADFYWGYVKKWWPYHDREQYPNVLLWHYSNVRRDLKGHVKELAKFLDVELTPSELDTVTERCGIEHMKKANKFNYLMPLNKDKQWNNDKDSIIRDGKIIRSGNVGKAKGEFSEKVVSAWTAAEEEEFGHDPAMLKWAREGGNFPLPKVIDLEEM